ncbi:DUF4267 domain-containing protein [Mucilaginibacter gynuensis]|uniref:DUF4267 domain-containing protein n=1 Tax=Mucilaginibacter gynuensis TaxID=1302236 RepID=A0ABP8GM43_9SPHI
MKTQHINFWGPRSASYWLTALLAIGIIFIGGRFIVAPQAGADGFGIPLAQTKEALAYGWIKGVRDIFSGIVLLVFLIRRQPHAAGIVFGAATIIPISDALTILAVNGTGDLTHLMIHGFTAVYMAITTVFLFKAKAEK